MIGSVMLLVFFLLFFLIRVRRPKNLPPEPRPLLILGNLLQLDPVNPLKDLERVRELYKKSTNLEKFGLPWVYFCVIHCMLSVIE
jgi:cytochrome P450 family 2 subfamily X